MNTFITTVFLAWALALSPQIQKAVYMLLSPIALMDDEAENTILASIRDEIRMEFATASDLGKLIAYMRLIEDTIQELDDPLREWGMQLIQSQFDDTDADIVALQSRINVLTSFELQILSRLILEQNQEHLYELLIFLQGNGITIPLIQQSETQGQGYQQCPRPKIQA